MEKSAQEAASEIQDGIYIGMSDDDYHKLPFLSASGMKDILISPMDYWAGSAMNPLPPTEKETEAKKIGKAYHTRILEGQAAFDKNYCAAFVAPKDAIVTMTDMKAKLVLLGLPTTGKTKAELADRILAADPTAKIADAMQEAYDEINKGKTVLKGEVIDRIQIAAAMIEKHPHLSKCFVGGYPEVTVVWTKEVVKNDGSGEVVKVRCKARFDYLKPKAIIDLKTFENFLNKSIEGAIYSAMASRKYHIQATHYMEAAQQAKALMRDRHVYKLMVAVTSPDKAYQALALPEEWEKAFMACDEHDFFFVFQKKGDAPLARGLKFPRTGVYGVALEIINEATQRFIEYRDRFGTDPWIDDQPITDMEDERFPAYAMEI